MSNFKLFISMKTLKKRLFALSIVLTFMSVGASGQFIGNCIWDEYFPGNLGYCNHEDNGWSCIYDEQVFDCPWTDNYTPRTIFP